MLNILKSEFIKCRSNNWYVLSMLIIIAVWVAFMIATLLTNPSITYDWWVYRVYSKIWQFAVFLTFSIWIIVYQLENIDSEKWGLLYTHNLRAKYFFWKYLFLLLSIFLILAICWISSLGILYYTFPKETLKDLPILGLLYWSYLLAIFFFLTINWLISLLSAKLTKILPIILPFIHLFAYASISKFRENLPKYWKLDPLYYFDKYFASPIFSKCKVNEFGDPDKITSSLDVFSSNIKYCSKIYMNHEFNAFYITFIVATIVLMAANVIYYRYREVR